VGVIGEIDEQGKDLHVPPGGHAGQGPRRRGGSQPVDRLRRNPPGRQRGAPGALESPLQKVGPDPLVPDIPCEGLALLPLTRLTEVCDFLGAWRLHGIGTRRASGHRQQHQKDRNEGHSSGSGAFHPALLHGDIGATNNLSEIPFSLFSAPRQFVLGPSVGLHLPGPASSPTIGRKFTN
jgi:hypothetical protein